MDDRTMHFLPSNPNIFAWAVGSLRQAVTRWQVPADLSCPNGRAHGRWLWKTGNSCNDANNVGRPSETFVLEEMRLVGNRAGLCRSPPETFISCFDFLIEQNGAMPPPSGDTNMPAPMMPPMDGMMAGRYGQCRPCT